MDEYVVAKEKELQDGERIIVQVEGREIGIFNIDGEYVAYTNWCVHQGGPCTEGSITGTKRADYDPDEREVSLNWSDDDILNCPWHGWEYDIKTGECLSRKKVRLPEHEINIRDGEIVLSL
ncbi:Rieske (2Fe-2S) protein [Natrialbaceae archaeon AArc-T1-2]|uniref:Rieske (2Fe-2S) protein n=1 Tax=Natrialbaceae archaeon AArc-T1-2 TaxID=3053904 RepID=UPI00255B141A|nr:Rieske 2Fe-2S domain-containing protein [Natrialbaceae archaeon AArc-T1-2]WIV68736.1 Rieske 2Fe-2S domain-containing protein [Natrialbaceae archaeon AArc-T1-2]